MSATLMGFFEGRSFGRLLREIRWILKLTQHSIAESVGVSKSAVSQYEADKRVPQGPTFGSLFAYLETVASLRPPVVRTRAVEKLEMLKCAYAPRRSGPRLGITNCAATDRESETVETVTGRWTGAFSIVGGRRRRRDT